jgi:hypothetical protein
MIRAAIYSKILNTKIGDSSSGWTKEEAEDLKFKTEQPTVYRMKKFLGIAETLGMALGLFGAPIAALQTAGLGMAPLIGAGAALAISPVLGVVAGVAGFSAVAYGLAKGIEYLNGEEKEFSLPSKEETLLKIKDVTGKITEEVTDYSTNLVQPKRKIQP